MKKIVCLCISSLCLLVLFTQAFMPNKLFAASENLVSNGDFENMLTEGKTELEFTGVANDYGYGSLVNFDSPAKVVVDPTNSENSCLKLSYKDKAFSSFFKFVTLEDDVTYQIDLDYMVEGTTANFGMRLAPIQGEDVLKVFYSGAVTDGWKHASFELKTNKDGAYDSIGLWFDTASNASNAGYIDNLSIKKLNDNTEPEEPTEEFTNPFDPEKTYYQSKSLTLNGDFEAFDEGTVFSEEQLEGAWGSVSLDMPARIVTKDGSKVVDLTKTDDTHVYSSCFLMLPNTLETGDLMRVSYDIKLELTEDASSYREINSCLVGGSNIYFYTFDYKTIDFSSTTNKTSGTGYNYPIVITEKENGWYNVSFDYQVTNKDLIQTNSIRWLITPHSASDHFYLDNVNVYQLSLEPFAEDKAVESITFSDGAVVTINVDETKTLAYTINPTDATDKTVNFTSSDEKVATVDQTGVVKGVGKGACVITVTSTNGVTQTIAVNVNAKTNNNKTSIAPILIALGVVLVGAGAAACVIIVRKKKH